MLVLRTALTYLELRGVLRQGTPFYAGYEVQLLRPMAEITAEFAGPHGQFVRDIFAQARRGTKWYALNPDDVAAALEVERRRVVRALEYLEEHGWALLRVADVRQRYTRLRETEDGDALVGELLGEVREAGNAGTDALAAGAGPSDHVDGCQTNALVGYFGEQRAERMRPLHPLRDGPGGVPPAAAHLSSRLRRFWMCRRGNDSAPPTRRP